MIVHDEIEEAVFTVKAAIFSMKNDTIASFSGPFFGTEGCRFESY